MITEREKQDIGANIHFLQARIASLATAAGRKADAVRLVAVTKTQDWERVTAAIQAGVAIIGENRWQEARDKIPAEWAAMPPGGSVGEDCARAGLHFIGHLQKNKARKAAGFFDCIQSVDELDTLALISNALAADQRTIDIMFEYNTSGEDAKQGIRSPDALLRLVEAARALPGIKLRGLMTIGPLGSDERRCRAAFATLANLHQRVAQELAPPGWTELSMGMSGDYPWAIAEGATMVRIGTAIFGPRLAGR